MRFTRDFTRKRVEKRVMPTRRICQLCKNHRPGSRKPCVRCNKLVGPGCNPEHWRLLATCRSQSALVSDNARYMHSRTCHSQSQNISPSFVSELTVNKTMRRYSLGFCEPQGKCNCIRERNGLSGSVAFRFVSCRRVAFRLLSCRRCVRPLVHLRFLSFCVDASWKKRRRQT